MRCMTLARICLETEKFFIYALFRAHHKFEKKNFFPFYVAYFLVLYRGTRIERARLLREHVEL